MSESSRSESNYNRDSNHRKGGFNQRNDRNSSSDRQRGGKNFGEKPYGDRNRQRGEYSRDDRRSGGFREDRNERRDFTRSDRSESRGSYRGDSDRGGFGGRRNDDRKNFDRRGGFKDRNGSDRLRFKDDRRGSRDNRRDEHRSFSNNESRFSEGHQRGGQQRREARDNASGVNAGYRPSKGQGPEIDTDVTGRELDGSVLRQLRALEKENAEVVGQHLVMAGRYLDIDPKFALEHATAATRRAGRIAAVREAAGIAAYVAEDFELALRELRTHRRISGSDEHLAVLIDTERALGRIEKALELAEESKQLELKPAERVETAIVVSGIKHDQGDLEGAIQALEIPELNSQRGFDYSPRLFESYGALLEEAGREKEATRWYRLAVVTEAALGQGEFEEPEIFDIFGEPELFEDEEEPSVAIPDIEFKEVESGSTKESDESETEAEEDSLVTAETVVSDEQADEENLQEINSAEEPETEKTHED